MEDEEVSLVNGVFEGAFIALGGLEMEALVDAMKVYAGAEEVFEAGEPFLLSLAGAEEGSFKGLRKVPLRTSLAPASFSSGGRGCYRLKIHPLNHNQSVKSQRQQLNNLEVSITSINKPNLSEAEDSTMSIHYTGKEPSSAPAKDNKKGSSASKTSSAPAGKLKNVKIKDDHLLAFVMKEHYELNLQHSKKKSSHFRNHQPQQTSQRHTGQGESSLRSRPSRSLMSFPSYILCGYNDH
nr:hypothetical protein [Tanacetum cinerariifolium]